MVQLILGEKPLSLKDVYEVAVQNQPVELSAQAVSKIQTAHQFLIEKIKTGDTYYGVNTGFGLLSNVRISPEDLEGLQYNLIRSHACGMGTPIADRYVRAMLLLRAANLAMGHSGVSLQLVEQILLLLNRGVIPIVPEQGSVGASGDLAPLSHLALPLIGEGRAKFKGEEMSGSRALELAGIKPIRLGPKEGLALINGTQFMSAMGVLSLLDAEHLCDVADLAGALSLEALRGTSTAFDPLIHAVRPHPGQVQVAQHLRWFVAPEEERSEIGKSHEACSRVQDPYSLRCIPQVHGATRDALLFVRQVFEREINSATDNPLVFPHAGKILSGGNFHGQILAIGMDLLAISIAELASISEQRIEKLVNPSTSGLPAFLTLKGGLNSGFMILQVTAASIVSENKTLCHPASVDSIPTSADKEDHVSMGAWSARKAAQVVNNARRVLLLELLSAAQGIHLLRPMRTTESLEKVLELIRTRVRPLDGDRSYSEDFVAMEELLGSIELRDLLQEAFVKARCDRSAESVLDVSFEKTPFQGSDAVH
jgi:histidine ammonia-lyase